MSKRYNKSPSDILNIKNSYTAYCIDEASLILLNALENGEKLNYKSEIKHYSNFSDFYNNFK